MHRDSTFVVLLVTLLAVVGQSQAFAQGECEPWQVLGGSMNADVRALVVFDDGNGQSLYAGGEFTLADGVAANRIARWDGSAWHPLGEGLNGTVLAMAVFDDGSGPALYVGGSFTRAGGTIANRVARWDGAAWSPLGTSLNNTVDALCVYDDGTGPALFAGGEFTTADGVSANRIARWDGDAWSSLGSGVDGGVTTIAVYDDGSGEALYAGGWFSQAGGVPARHIARWDGMQWSGLGEGLGDLLGNIVVFDDGSGPKLVVSGWFSGCMFDCNLSVWDGSRWSRVYVTGLDTYEVMLGVHDAPLGQDLLISSYYGITDCEYEGSYCRDDAAIVCDGPGIVSLHSSYGVVRDLSPERAETRYASALFQFPRTDGNTVIGAYGRAVLERTNRCVDVYVSGDVCVESAAAVRGVGLYDYDYSGFVIQPRRTASLGLTSSGFGDDRASGSWEFEATVGYGEQSTILSVRSFKSGEVIASGLFGAAELWLGLWNWSMYFTIDEPLNYSLDEDLFGVELVLRRRSGGGPIVGRRLQPGDYSIVPVGYLVSLFVELGTLADARRLNFDLTLTRPEPCPADLDGDGELTIFDFLEFQNLFAAGDPRADFDGDGQFTIFDFLAFQNAFDAGCP